MIKVEPILLVGARPILAYAYELRTNGQCFCTQDGLDIIIMINDINYTYIDSRGYVTHGNIDKLSGDWIPCHLKISGVAR